MDLVNALHLQMDVFRDIFHFEEVPAALASSDKSFGMERLVGDETEIFPVGEQSSIYPTVLEDPFLSSAFSQHRHSSSSLKDFYKKTRNIALGIGLSANQPEQHELVVIYQDHKLKKDRILDRIGGLARGEVRFSYSGPVRALATTPWHRGHVVDPLRIGSSLAHFNVPAGTLGCFVTHKVTGARGILSNNHVLANVNKGKYGDGIRQPSKADGGTNSNLIATLEQFVPMLSSRTNYLDCAWASLPRNGGRALSFRDIFNSADVLVNKLCSINPVLAWPDMQVVKVGRTTGYSEGSVDAINVNNLNVRYGNNIRVRFDRQIQIKSLSRSHFARPGDSGAVVLDSNSAPVGLLFSGSDKGGGEDSGYTWANPIGDVLNSLDLEILL